MLLFILLFLIFMKPKVYESFNTAVTPTITPTVTPTVTAPKPPTVKTAYRAPTMSSTNCSLIQTERDNLRSQVTSLSTENNKYKNSVLSLTTERDKFKSERDSFELDTKSYASERDNYKNQVSTLTNERDKNLSEKNECFVERDGLKTEKDKLTTERNTCVTERNTLSSEKIALETEKNNLKEQKENLQKQLESFDAYKSTSMLISDCMLKSSEQSVKKLYILELYYPRNGQTNCIKNNGRNNGLSTENWEQCKKYNDLFTSLTNKENKIDTITYNKLDSTNSDIALRATTFGITNVPSIVLMENIQYKVTTKINNQDQVSIINNERVKGIYTDTIDAKKLKDEAAKVKTWIIDNAK